MQPTLPHVQELIEELKNKFEAQATEFMEFKAAQALLEGKKAGSDQSVVDMKSLGRPSIFHRKHSEWRDRSFSFKAFCTAVSEYMGERMDSDAALEVDALLASVLRRLLLGRLVGFGGRAAHAHCASVEPASVERPSVCSGASLG